ncbi:DUF554 domain-containing protein [Symbiobacterium thermophilum]|uniref:DUF554 domain-containing protein n=1 Tax=Symbiobacterium thermophilum (strain DSM 24528 / JCM 14929 / IAM 14863 / T) TaxID=292459 RepID=Q67JQ9_SYMTH|nr:DUF554 domain-containing protein [Symbiobacterium thermophilum]BAD42091.1 conserved hypothetical protein [Symbiobacterium thermophilum IAM 14863]
MVGLGTLANVGAVLLGGALGSLVIPQVPEEMRTSTMKALGLAVVLIGLKMAWETESILLLVVSLALGTMLGEWLRIEDRLQAWARRLERWPITQRGGFAKGFVQASLLFCTGAMAITGALEDGLNGNPSILYAKSILDGVASIMFGSVMGVGVMFAAVPVLVYQGLITLGASAISRFLTEAMIREISATGGLMVAAIGFNLMGAAEIRIGNLLPGLVVVAALAGVFL